MVSRFSICTLPFSSSAIPFSRYYSCPTFHLLSSSGNPSNLTLHHRHPYIQPFESSRRSRLVGERVSASSPLMAAEKFSHQLLIPLQTHQHFLMEQQGCIYLIHVHMHSVHGLPETLRYVLPYPFPFQKISYFMSWKAIQGLQEKIQLVPIDLQNRPIWYKEKVYPPNKVPALEHRNEVKGESLDLIRYIDSNFEGPSLFPDEPTKIEFAEALLSYTDDFNLALRSMLKTDGTSDTDAALDLIETYLSKFDDGSFFLGQFSLVDIAYAPFIERYQPFLLDVKGYDIIANRPKLATWIEEMNKIEGYKRTRLDPQVHVDGLKKRFLAKM